MSFRFSEVLLLFSAGLWLVHAVQLARIPFRQSWSSFVIVGLATATMALSYALVPSQAGRIAVAGVVLFLLLPRVLARLASRSLRWGRIGRARGLALLAFVLRPLAFQRRFRRALEISWRLGSGEEVDLDAAIETLGPSNASQARAHRVAFLSWANDFEAMSAELADPKVRELSMRAGMAGIVTTVVGETADDLEVLSHAVRLLGAPGVHNRGIDATWALVAMAAYLGDVKVVTAELASLEREVPPDRRAFILATAQQRAGKVELARATVEAALAAGGGVPSGLERLRYRLRSPRKPVALLPGLAEARAKVAKLLRVRRTLGELGVGLSKPAPLTLAMAAALSAIFAWQTTQTRLAVFSGLALNHPFERAPDPWRLWTYACVHLNVAHVLVNVIGLLIFGRFVERLFGRAKFLLIYGAGAAGGGLAYLTFATQEGVALGASGAVFALIGATVLRIAVDTEVRRSRQGRRELLFLVSIMVAQFALDAAWAQSSGSAHAGGLVAGVVLAAVMLALRPPGRARRVAA